MKNINVSGNLKKNAFFAMNEFSLTSSESIFFNAHFCINILLFHEENMRRNKT